MQQVHSCCCCCCCCCSHINTLYVHEEMRRIGNQTSPQELSSFPYGKPDGTTYHTWCHSIFTGRFSTRLTYHSGRKYKTRLNYHVKIKRQLYFRPYRYTVTPIKKIKNDQRSALALFLRVRKEHTAATLKLCTYQVSFGTISKHSENSATSGPAR